MMIMMTMVQLLPGLAAVLAAGHRPSTYQPTGMPKGPLSMLSEQVIVDCGLGCSLRLICPLLGIVLLWFEMHE